MEVFGQPVAYRLSRSDSQPTVSKVMSQFVDAITAKASQYIYVPRNREVAKIKNDFYMLAGFPGVVSCIDGSHIHQDEFVNVNRKKSHLLTTQAVCDSNLVFQDVVARWPGSHHDSFIIDMSSLSSRFENGDFENS